MKKLVITLLSIVSLSAFAQEDEIRFGAKAGLNVSTVVSDDLEDNKAKIGFNIGGLVEIPVADSFAVQPELLFSTQGTTEEYTIGNVTEKYNLKLSYLNIPVLAKYYVAEGLSLAAGPQVGIAVTREVEVEIDGDSATVDADDFYKAIDFSLALGAGYQLESGIFVDARYNLGLSNISDVEGFDVKNSVFQFSVGYKF